MAAEGADLLDVGGESTRPGAQPLDAAEERRRVLPVIEELVSRVSIPISVDTYKASIARAALEAGASLVNDISGLRYEPDLAEVVAKHRAAIILMHTRGRSKDMYKQAVYSEVVDEVLDELRESIAFAGGRRHRRRTRSWSIPDLALPKSRRTATRCLAGSGSSVTSGVPSWPGHPARDS